MFWVTLIYIVWWFGFCPVPMFLVIINQCDDHDGKYNLIMVCFLVLEPISIKQLFFPGMGISITMIIQLCGNLIFLIQIPLLASQGAVSIRKTVLLGMAIPMLKIRRPTGRLIFNMGIPIPGKTVFLIETGPSISKLRRHPQSADDMRHHDAETPWCWWDP